MNRILQAHVAKSINFFKKEFLSTYNLVEYNDPNKPAVFFGAEESAELINKHNSYKVILPCRPDDIPQITDYKNTLFICSDNFILPENVIRKSLTPRIKNYDMFKPNRLGDKVYFYSGFRNGHNLWPYFIEDLRKKVDYEIITTDHNHLSEYYTLEYLKENYYDKSFLNINFSPGAGLSSVIELGLMGRKTVFKPSIKNNIQRLEFPNFIYLPQDKLGFTPDSIDDVVKVINEESKKIGSIQPPIDAHNIKDEWLDLDFWLS